MASNAEVHRYLEAFRGHDDAETTAYQLLQGAETLVPGIAVTRLLREATDFWLGKVRADSSAIGSRVLALSCLRQRAGYIHGFAADREITRLSDTHYHVTDFDTWIDYHFELDSLPSRYKVLSETIGLAEFTLEMLRLIGELRRRLAAGEDLVQPGAQLGSPTGVFWTTPTPVFQGLRMPNTAVADNLRNRLGLADARWEKGRALIQYAIDTTWLDKAHRPTPLEGGGRRFRLHPYRAIHGAFGATVNLQTLKDNVSRAVPIDDDGVRECVSPPVIPDRMQWRTLLDNLRFAGPLSEGQYLPDCTDAEYRKRIMDGASHDDTVRGLMALLD